MSKSDKFIDVERVIAEKNPKLLKRMPSFLLRYLKRKVHEDDINNFIVEHEDFYDVDFCVAVMEFLELDIQVHGLENIPKEGGVILASNHPLGGVDAMALVPTVSAIRTDVKFIVNDILMNLKSMSNMFAGVDKMKKNSRDSLRIVDELFASENAVFVFPAGLVSRRRKGKVEDLEWKKTFISRARKHKRNIVPVYIDGELSNFFYRLANFRKFIGIKANIEMLYLADELFKQKGKSLHIVFGEPIDYRTLDESKKDSQWAEEIKRKVYSQKLLLKS